MYFFFVFLISFILFLFEERRYYNTSAVHHLLYEMCAETRIKFILQTLPIFHRGYWIPHTTHRILVFCGAYVKDIYDPCHNRFIDSYFKEASLLVHLLKATTGIHYHMNRTNRGIKRTGIYTCKNNK